MTSRLVFVRRILQKRVGRGAVAGSPVQRLQPCRQTRAQLQLHGPGQHTVLADEHTGTGE